MTDLSGRDNEILRTLVQLWESSGHQPFHLAPDADTLDHTAWPDGVAKPTRKEVRALVGRDLMMSDKSTAPTWRVWPSTHARKLFAGSAEHSRAEALRDADQRLGVILDAIVDAFESDPSEPLLLFRASSADIVKHPGWPIEPDVVRTHDLRQLEDLGLVGWESETQFYPTPRGRMAARNPIALLSQLAEATSDDEERSRLRTWAEKFRAGDVAVGTAGGLTSAVIRVLLGF